MSTIRKAPEEIRDILGNIRQEICEERAAIRTKIRELRASDRDLRAGRSSIVVGRTLTEQTLRLHHASIRDIWRDFKRLERPFLVPNGFRAEQVHRGHYWGEDDLDEHVRGDLEKYGENSMEDWTAYYRCDFSHRFIWLQSKSAVMNLADLLTRIMMRRISREVDQCRLMLRQMGENHRGPEGGGLAGFNDDGGGGGNDGNTNAQRRTRSKTGTVTAAAAAAAAVTTRPSDSESDGPQRQSNMARRRDESVLVERRRRPPPPQRESRPRSNSPISPNRNTRSRSHRRQEPEWEVIRPSQQREGGGVRVIEIDVPPGHELDIEREERSRSRYDTR